MNLVLTKQGTPPRLNVLAGPRHSLSVGRIAPARYESGAFERLGWNARVRPACCRRRNRSVEVPGSSTGILRES